MLPLSVQESLWQVHGATQDQTCQEGDQRQRVLAETKSHSGMTRQRRKAAPPAEDLAKYFAKKMSLPGEESKEVPELEPAPPGARRLRGFKITLREVSKVLQSLDVRKSVGPG